MRYQCVHCDLPFEAEASDKPRCPKCMRVHGIRALAESDEKKSEGGTHKRPGLAIALGVLIVASSAGAWWMKQRAGSTGGESAVSAGDLEGSLEKQGLANDPLAALFNGSDGLEAFAERAAGEKSSAKDKAQAVTQALRARAKAQAFVPWPMSDARSGPPLTAVQTLHAIERDGARKQLYPFELAVLGVAALRTLDVPAQLAEVFAASTDPAPLEPSGRIGYFVIALPSDAPNAAAQLFDGYGGRTTFGDHALLSDREALGAALSLRALGRLEANEDPAGALRDADAAVALLPTSPTVRSARGTALLLSAATDPGRAELQAAAQMRPDGPRLNNIAMLDLAMGDSERATRGVSQALEKQPEFALGHITLAAIHMSRGDRDEAAAELDKAESFDPNLTALQLSRAELHASSGQLEQAIAEAQRAIEARPSNPQARLLLARIYREASRYDAMREQAKQVLALAPEALKERTRELILRLLGPTALESFEPDAPAVAAPGTDTPQLQLDAPDTKLDDGPRLRLNDDPASPGVGALQGSPGEPKLRLTEPGKRLSLDQP